MRFDLINNLRTFNAFAPVAARTADGAITSAIFDTLGLNSAALILSLGTNTDVNATFAVTLAHSDASNMAGAVAVPAEEMNGGLSNASFNFADDAETRKLGYIGVKRYIQATITIAGNDSGNVFFAGVWLGEDQIKPPINPPTS